jgi:hypothetical protein
MKKRCRSALALMMELLDAQDPCFSRFSGEAEVGRDKALEAWKTLGDYLSHN